MHYRGAEPTRYPTQAAPLVWKSWDTTACSHFPSLGSSHIAVSLSHCRSSPHSTRNIRSSRRSHTASSSPMDAPQICASPLLSGSDYALAYSTPASAHDPRPPHLYEFYPVIPELYPGAYLLYALFDYFRECKAAVFRVGDKMIDKIWYIIGWMDIAAFILHLGAAFHPILEFRLPRRKHRGIKPNVPAAARFAAYINKEKVFCSQGERQAFKCYKCYLCTRACMLYLGNDDR